MKIADTLKKPAYDLAELRQLVPLSRTAIYQAIAEKRLRSVKAGRRTLFLADDVVRWLDELRRAPAKAEEPADD